MKTLVMCFLNAAGSKVNVRLNYVKDVLDAAAVNAAMDGLIAKNILKTSRGDLVSKDSAYLTETTKQDVAL